MKRAINGSMLCALLGAAACVHGALPDDAQAVAWLRGGDETYDSTPYTFLGACDWELRIDVAPQAGASLELLWGSKGDVRSAVVQVNGHTLPVSGGGDYNGFRWLRVPLPEAVRGERYDVLLKAGEGKAAFIAEVRLTLPGGDPGRPALDRARHRVTETLKNQAAGFTGEAFPELRKVWDTPSAAFPAASASAQDAAAFRLCERHARQANEALFRSRRFVDGWLAKADPATGLIPRNLRESRDFWNGRDAAADNYPFMVLTAAMTDRALFEGRMLDMLRTETRLTCRVGRLPDDYAFSKKGWRRESVDLDALIFDGAEYVKDGLCPSPSGWGPALGARGRSASSTTFGRTPRSRRRSVRSRR